MRVLITGGAGFIGSHLADRLLADGDSVTVLDDLSTGSHRNIRHNLDHPRFKFVNESVLNLAAVEREVAEVDHVYHLAAAVGVQLIVDRPLQSLITNIKGTENLLEAAERSRRKILIVSTSEIYGKSQNGPFKEDDDRLLGPTSKLRWSYSTSKAVDEILAFTYYRELGLPTVVVRLFNTIGPRQVGNYGMVLPRFVAQALRNEPVTVYGDGKQTRTFTAVTDVVEAMKRLMDTPIAEGEVVNIASDNEITIEGLAELVIARSGSSSALTYVPYQDVYGKGFEDMSRRAADTSKLAALTGFQCRTSLEEIIDAMVAYERDLASVQ